MPVKPPLALYWAICLVTALALGSCHESLDQRQLQNTRKLHQSSAMNDHTAALGFATCIAEIKGLRIVYPGDTAFSRVSMSWNLRTLSTPAAVVFPKSTADVSAIVKCCITYRKQPVARSGGHSYAGYCVQRNKVTVDLSNMNQVTLARNGQTATIMSGALLGPVYLKLWTLSNGTLGFAAGTCSNVGIAGLILGGGFGMSARKHGLSSDRLVSIEMVNAQGKIITASSRQNSDLYWASKGGGGGNFGIVTSFTVKPIPIKGNVTVVFMQWSSTKYAKVIDWYVRKLPGLDPNFSSDLFCGYDFAKLHGVYYGAPSKARAVLEAAGVLGIGQARFVRYESMNWASAMAEFAGRMPRGISSLGLGPGVVPIPDKFVKAKSNYISSPITPKGLATAAASVSAASTRGLAGWLQLHAYGGVINTIDSKATAFVHRNKLANLQYYVSWDDPKKAEVSKAWLQEIWSSMQPFVEQAAYQNYMDSDLGNDSLQAYYGTNLQRLMAVKRQYDPKNFFNYPNSIPAAKK